MWTTIKERLAPSRESRLAFSRALGRRLLDGTRSFWSAADRIGIGKFIERRLVARQASFRVISHVRAFTHRWLLGEEAASDAVDLSELDRYVKALQRQVMTEGTEEWFSHQRHMEWLRSNRATLGESVPERVRAAAVADYVGYMERFTASSEHDSATAAAVFQPLMQEVLDAAERLGMRTGRSITLGCAPSIETTPFTRPSDGVHIILIGTATSAFCNYWAKIFLSMVHGHPVQRKTPSGPRPSRLSVEAIRDATRLALYYGHVGTVLGFGVLPSPPKWMAPRMEYVTAMEVFVLAHEYGHCILEEASQRYRGMLSADVNRELELKCDVTGAALSREYGATTNSWVAFCGAGATLFLYAYEICERARSLFGDVRRSHVPTHPPARDRIAAIRTQVITTTPHDQRDAVISFLDDVSSLCEELYAAVIGILEGVAQEQRDESIGATSDTTG